MPFSLKRLTDQISEPVSLADMKAHLTIDGGFTADDDLLTAMISSARQEAEDYLGRSLAQQQWLFAIDGFPCFRLLDSAPSRSDYDALGNYTFAGLRSANQSQTITLPRPPLVSVDSVQYVDLVTTTLTTLDPSAYQVDEISQPARILPAIGSTWPQAAPVANAVQITFSAGLATIPPNTAMAIKLRVAAYYTNREEFLTGAPQQGEGLFERLLGSQGRTHIFGYVGR